ncbi:MAG: hypothetical protein HFF58_06880 [Lawsonibacter sp.]|nr:hypothetical protein [Lawsonibacter sp.]
MSIGLTFAGRIESPSALAEAVKILADQRGYLVGGGTAGLRVAMCPLGGELNLFWRPVGEPTGPWLARGACLSTPAGAGLHRAAVELLESLPIRDLTVEDETGFYRVRDFRRMKEEHFYPWLRTLVDVCRQEQGKGVSGMQLCWDLEQYAPEDILDTVVTPMGRFRLDELADIVEAGGIQALADRFFLWDGRTQDARFYRNRAINALWEKCYFAPSTRSLEDTAVNAAILDDLERAAKLDPALPLPRASYEEVCALADRTPALPDGPVLEEAFSPGYRKGAVTHSLGALRLTLPGVYRYERESESVHLWGGLTPDDPVWRVVPYQVREGEAGFTDNLSALNGAEDRELKGGALRWGWREVREEGQRLFLAECEVITGPALFLVTATCTAPADLGAVAGLIGRIQVVSTAARKETVQAQK